MPMRERPEKKRLRGSERACDKERARGPDIHQIPQEMREVKHAWTPPLRKFSLPGIICQKKKWGKFCFFEQKMLFKKLLFSKPGDDDTKFEE